MPQQPLHATETHRHWMGEAMAEARKALPLDVPVGAVVLCRGQVIARACNTREVAQTPLGHAELSAIAQAAKALGSWRLAETILYVTLEPCPMCASAIAQARIPMIVFGAYDALAGACGSRYSLLPSPGQDNTTPTVLGGIQEDACARLLKDFFTTQRP